MAYYELLLPFYGSLSFAVVSCRTRNARRTLCLIFLVKSSSPLYHDLMINECSAMPQRENAIPHMGWTHYHDRGPENYRQMGRNGNKLCRGNPVAFSKGTSVEFFFRKNLAPRNQVLCTFIDNFVLAFHFSDPMEEIKIKLILESATGTFKDVGFEFRKSAKFYTFLLLVHFLCLSLPTAAPELTRML